MSGTTCVICSKADPLRAPQVVGVLDVLAADAVHITCPRCGKYIVEADFIRFSLGPIPNQDVAIRLSGVVRRATDTRGSFAEIVTRSNYEQLASSGAIAREPDELIDRLLLAIADRVTFMSETTQEENADAWVARLFLPGRQALQDFLEEMSELNLLTAKHGEMVSFKLTHGGWRRVHEVKQLRGPGNQAFVAMWFHRDLDQLFDDHLLPGLQEVGYLAYRVDRGNTNTKIDDAIIAEIRRSKIMVADFTGGRPSVYFEAGLAYGLGMPVIWCCNETWPAYAARSLAPKPDTPPEWDQKNWSDQLAFDVRQEPFLMWSDFADLRSKLVQRIRRRGLDLGATHAKSTP